MGGPGTRPNPLDYSSNGEFHAEHQRLGYHRDGRCLICFPDSMGPTNLDTGKDPRAEETLEQLKNLGIGFGNVVTVGTLNDLLDNTVGGRRFFNDAAKHEKIKKYPLVTVLNPGEGPDEQMLRITAVTWDHNYGVLRLEVGE